MIWNATSPTRRRRFRYAVGAVVITVGIYALATSGPSGGHGADLAAPVSPKG